VLERFAKVKARKINHKKENNYEDEKESLELICTDFRSIRVKSVSYIELCREGISVYLTY